jgi:hypothetical protein
MTAKNDPRNLSPFAADPPYVAPWFRDKSGAFDAERSEKEKRAGMSASASARQLLLDVLRRQLVRIAVSRTSRSVSADDAQEWLAENGYDPAALGNAAGSLFRSEDWVLVGYVPSERVSRHRNRVGVWQYQK